MDPLEYLIDPAKADKGFAKVKSYATTYGGAILWPLLCMTLLVFTIQGFLKKLEPSALPVGVTVVALIFLIPLTIISFTYPSRLRKAVDKLRKEHYDKEDKIGRDWSEKYLTMTQELIAAQKSWSGAYGKWIDLASMCNSKGAWSLIGGGSQPPLVNEFDLSLKDLKQKLKM